MPSSLANSFFNLLDGINAATTIPEAWNCYISAARSVGLPFGIASYFRSDRSFGTTTFASTVPDEWIRNYFAKDYQTIDPIVRRLSLSAQPFTWSLHDWDGLLDDRQKAWQRDNEEAGIRDGLIITDRSKVDPRVIALCGNAGKLDPHDFKALHYAGLEMLSHMDELGLPQAIQQSTALSAREKECLRWLAAGKSDEDIGTILLISAKTVATYVERAKQKLGVTSRAQPIVAAMRQGDLT